MAVSEYMVLFPCVMTSSSLLLPNEAHEPAQYEVKNSHFSSEAKGLPNLFRT